jgi:hypothetical protein
MVFWHSSQTNALTNNEILSMEYKLCAPVTSSLTSRIVIRTKWDNQIKILDYVL